MTRRSLVRLAAPFILLGATLALTPSPVTAQSGSFGHSVLIYGPDLLIAEPTTNFRPGAVYVYRRDDAGWNESAVLHAPEPEIADGFGTALAAAGNTLFVGQRGGPIHVFALAEDGGWQSAGTITDEEVRGFAPECRFDGYCGTDFGVSLAAAGDWLMVGTPGPASGPSRAANADGAGGLAGVVHAYSRDGEQWVKQAELSAADGGSGDRFGATLAFTAHGLLIAAPGWSAPETEDAEGDDRQGTGRVYRYRLSNGLWIEAGVLESVAEASANFGTALSSADDRLFVGAPGADGNRGAVFVHAWDADLDRWVPDGSLELDDGAGGDRFGAAVALSGADVWVGAPTERENEIGSVFLYEAADDGNLPQRPRRIQLPQEETVERDRFGGPHSRQCRGRHRWCARNAPPVRLHPRL